MYTIKRYANGRFYDTEAKNYITRPQILAMRKGGKKFVIIDTKTEADITADVLAPVKTSEKKMTPKAAGKKSGKKAGPGGTLAQLIKKGGDSLFDYGKKYASMWQNMVTMSREEIDKLVNLLVKDNKISEFEAEKVKKEIQRYRKNVENWFSKTIDRQVKDILGRMNLANRDQIVRLTKEIDALNKKIKTIEKGKGAATAKSLKTKVQAVKPAPVPEKKSPEVSDVKVPEINISELKPAE
jgi:polyhydroxyalkanoate synthesis regulator protein